MVHILRGVVLYKRIRLYKDIQALVILRNAIWAVAIFGFFVLYPDLTEVKDYEIAWFRLGFENLPAGILGFFFAAIVAIHISTISTHPNLGAIYITRDLYHHHINPKATQEKLVKIGRIGTLILLLGSFVFGSIMENITEWLIFALWIMAAGVWLPGILQVIWWRFNGWGYLSAWVFNLVFSWLVIWVLPAFGVLPHLKDYQQFWLLMLLGAIVFIPVTFLTKPEDMDHLANHLRADTRRSLTRRAADPRRVRGARNRRGTLRRYGEDHKPKAVGDLERVRGEAEEIYRGTREKGQVGGLIVWATN